MNGFALVVNFIETSTFPVAELSLIEYSDSSKYICRAGTKYIHSVKIVKMCMLILTIVVNDSHICTVP